MKNLCISSGVALLLALFSFWPYSFYILLRWFICGISIYIAYNFYQLKNNSWVWIFAALAFVFNPIFPIYLSKSAWTPIDLIGAVLFFIAADLWKK